MNSPLKLDFNERCDGSPAWLSLALKSYADTEVINDLWRYPDRSVLEAAIAKTFSIEAENVLVTNGGDEGIDLLLRLAARENRQLVLPLPAFSQYLAGATRNQITVVAIAADVDLRVNLKSLLQSIQPDQIIALTSPNNPTGESLDRSLVKQIIEKATQAGNTVLIDEAYIEFSNEPSFAEEYSNNDNVIILRSFSKAWGMAGLRLGYLLGSKRKIAALRELTAPFNVSSISLKLGLDALGDAAQAEVRSHVTRIQFAREALRAQLLSFGIPVAPSAANFLLLSLTSKRAQLLAAVLRRENVFVRTFADAPLQACVRITVPRDLSRLSRLLSQVLAPTLLCLDMDGVLIDTSASYDACVIATVKHFGGGELPPEQLQATRNDGNANDDWALTQLLLKKRGIDKALNEVKSVFQQFYLGKNGFQTREIMCVSQATAAALRKRKTAVVTGRPVDEAINGTQSLPWTVDALVSRDDVTALKPDPQGINAMQQRFKTTDSWMVGDSVDDMRAARAAGAVAIGIGLANANALVAAGADCVIATINEIGEIL